MIVHILDTATGKLVTSNEFETLPWNDYWWTEGNAACDCNRGLFFARACGRDTDITDDDECPCGDGRYKVQIVENGDIVLDEITDTATRQ